MATRKAKAPAKSAVASIDAVADLANVLSNASISEYVADFKFVGETKFGEEKQDQIAINFKNMLPTLINSLNRAMLSDVETISVSCTPDSIRENDTIYDSQFIALLRLSLIPVKTDKKMLADYEKYSVYLAGETLETPFENKADEIRSIYVHDLAVRKKTDTRGTSGTEPEPEHEPGKEPEPSSDISGLTTVDPMTVFKYDHLLLRLHKGQKIHIYDAKFAKGTGRLHTRFQSIIQRWYEPDFEKRTVKCTYETQGNYTVSDALKAGARVLYDKLDKIETQIIQHITDNVFVSFIIEQHQNEGGIDICVADSNGNTWGQTHTTVGSPRLLKLLLYGETETIGEPLFRYAYELIDRFKPFEKRDLVFKSVKPHPDEDKLIVSIAFEQSEKTTEEFLKMRQEYYHTDYQKLDNFPQQAVLLCCVCRHLKRIFEKLTAELP